MPELINPVEMYLKALLEMQEDHLPLRRTRISERLGQSGPTVTKTVRRMERDGLVSFSEGSKILRLTDGGFRVALSVLRKHRLAETFLDEAVGLDRALLHDEACRWEHVMSDDVATRIDDFLHHPSRSPYGNPIPAADQDEWDPLAEMPTASDVVGFLVAGGGTNRSGVLEWISEPAQDDPELLSRLMSAGIVPGARVLCVVRGATIAIRERSAAGSVELTPRRAANLIVRP